VHNGDHAERRDVHNVDHAERRDVHNVENSASYGPTAGL